MKLSICIPIHDPKNEYQGFIFECLKSIKNQTMQPDEIVLGGNYEPKYLKTIVNDLNLTGLITFIGNQSTSAPQNLNNLINKISNPLIKIIFQDDFLLQKESLLNSIKALESAGGWYVSRSKNFDDRSKTFVRNIAPRINHRLLDGTNQIGAPSVIAFHRDYFVPFNEDLKWLFDCEWYVHMFHKFGKPTISREFEVASRIHSGQATYSFNHLHNKELKQIQEIHERPGIFSALKKQKFHCSCLAI